MNDGTYRALRTLAEAGRIPCSALSARTARRLQPLLDAGAVVRRKRGRGMVLDVADRDALHRFTIKLFPHGDTLLMRDDGAMVPPRVEAVGTFRDAKRARTASAEPILLRATAPVKATRGASMVDLLELSRLAGAACLLLDDGENWRIEADIVIVENLEVFLHFEKLHTGRAVALYAGGRLSGRVLNWLASDEMSGASFLHCGDCDPVGLDEFLRLFSRLADRVEIHVPGSIAELFASYGKRSLLRDSAPILARLRGVEHASVTRLVKLMDATGCGLEQEALLLPAAQPASSASTREASSSPS